MDAVRKREKVLQTPSLEPFLQKVQARYHRLEWVHSDPIEFVLRFEDPWDQEAVALVSAQLAYGNVKQIRKSIQGWLDRIQAVTPSPASWVREGVWSPQKSRVLDDFVHRIHRGSDLLVLSRLQSKSWAQWGSLGAHLVSNLSSDAQNFAEALNAVLAQWQEWLREESGQKKPSRSVQHFLASPDQGSCCKRWCMLLRWMGRKDEVDPGLWMKGSPLLQHLGVSVSAGKGLQPCQLVMPLDTHVGTISQYLGLTDRKSLNWRAAVEITDRLREVSPEDPVRYDFALARLGILDLCQKKFVKDICGNCMLLSACRLAHRSIGTQMR